MFLTLSSPGEAETRVLGSRFLARALPAGDEAAARAEVAARERAMFDASHHCSAWRLHQGVWRANDAGEPSGSAGLPILAAIDGAGLYDCAVVVTRYFGGTKLGVGGLARAYGEAAAAALAAAPRRTAIPALRYRVRYTYPHTAPVMRTLERVGAAEVEHGFDEGGETARVDLTLPASAEALLHDLLREQTGGAVRAERLAARLLFRDAPG